MSETNEDIVISKIETMPDWKCSFCGTINPSNAISCKDCKKTREQSDAHFFELNTVEGLNPNEGATDNSIGKEETAPKNITQLSVATANVWARYFAVPKARVLLALTAAMLFSIVAWCSFKSPTAPQVTYKVASVKWERTIQIERYMSPKKSKRTKDSQKAYTPFRTVKSEGTNNSPAWPNPELGKSADGKPDKESKKTETYTVRLERENDSSQTAGKFPRFITLTTSESEFRELFVIGKTFTATKDEKGFIKPLSKDSTILKQLK
jgi:hypothetical protein